jgi:hypothetical protein
MSHENSSSNVLHSKGIFHEFLVGYLCFDLPQFACFTVFSFVYILK